MRDELDVRLMEAKTRLRSKERIEAMLREAESAVRDEGVRCADLKEKAVDDQADVKKLEKLSLTALFYTVLGGKEEQLEKERQEYLAARLKWEEAETAVEDAKRQVAKLQAELAVVANAGAEYQTLLQEKERWLASADNTSSAELLSMSERLAELQSQIQELREAVGAGDLALESLKRVSSDLNSASGWGAWDMMGGGMLSTMAKHSHMDSARRNAQNAQRQLRRFQQELADANQRLQVSLELDGLSRFADYFLDGLIIDWVVQSRINQASQACTKTASRVGAAVRDCRRRLDEVKSEASSLTRRRQELVERA